MKKFRLLSFRAQIFLISVLLVVLPTTVLSAYDAGKNIKQITLEYNTSTAALLGQMNQTLETLLQNALKIADTPLLNDDAKKAMITNYTDDYLTYAQDSSRFRSIMRQTNRLNSTLLTTVFQNRYGYSFEHNIVTVQHQHQIEDNISKWAPIARQQTSHTYFAPLQKDEATNRSVLPMIKIILDGYDFNEIGICYGEINFKPIADILNSSRDTQNTLLIYNTENELIWSNNSAFLDRADQYTSFLHALSDFSQSLTAENPITQSNLKTGTAHYAVNGCVNETSNWHLVQLVDNERITHVYRTTYLSYIRTFLLCALFGLILAIFLSRLVARPVSRLCSEIDALDPADGKQVSEASCGSNQELRQLVISFNGLNSRLAASLQQNYEIQLAEQQMRVQMLQFQINHHFLYNTLNVIKSLASIHEVPQIGTIATCMSDLIRYNLEKFPVARLEEELQQIRRYMTIQNIRFPGKFCCDINIPTEFLNMEIPAFLLQPLVENSIEHGFASKEDDCYISISCHLEADRLHFLVADNGCGISPEKLEELKKLQQISSSQPQKHHSIGLRNVSLRLRSYYGPECALSIESMPGEGTIIDIALPKSI